MSLPNGWDFGWPEAPNSKKRRVDDDPFAFSVPPVQPPAAHPQSSQPMPGAYMSSQYSSQPNFPPSPSQLPPINGQSSAQSTSQAFGERSWNQQNAAQSNFGHGSSQLPPIHSADFGQSSFSPITSQPSSAQLPPLQKPSQNSPMLANQAINSSPQNSIQPPPFQQQWPQGFLPAQQQQGFQPESQQRQQYPQAPPPQAFQSLPQTYPSHAPRQQQPQQSYPPQPSTQQSYHLNQAYKQPLSAQPYPQPRSERQPQQFQQPKPQLPPLSPQQFHRNSLAQQPSFDAQMFQSLQSSQFQSQGSSQSPASYSPQSTQVQWSSQSPSSVSQQLPRDGSLSQVQQPSPQLQPRPSPQLQQRPSPQLQQRPSPQLQAGLSPQLQTWPSSQAQQRPSPQPQTRLSPQLQTRPSPQLQQGLSPQVQQRPSPQMQQRPSPQVQHRPSPQLQQRPSPQVQHLLSPQQFASPQQQFASPQMPVQAAPQLQQLFAPQQTTQQLSPQAPQAYLAPQPPPQQQLLDFQQNLPPPHQQQHQAYQQPVPNFDMAQWEQYLQQSHQQPMQTPQQPPPPPPSQQQAVPTPQQPPQQPAPQQQYSGYNGLGGTEQYGYATPSSAPRQGEAIKFAAPSPSMYTTTIPPSFVTAHPSPSHPTPSPRPSQSSTMPKSSSKTSTPRPSLASQAVPSKRKSQPSQAPSQPSSRPVAPAIPAGKAGKAVPSQVTTSSPAHAPLPEAIPTAPLLFNTAISAHRNATYHLQQVFVPGDVQDGDKGGMKRDTATGKVLFTHDPDALNTALRLLVMALDLLRTGFYMPDLSDSERAAFGLEFATVAAKVLATEDPVKKLLTKEELARVQVVIDHKRLASDVEDVMTKTLAAARSPHLKHYRQGVELVSARLAFMKDKANHAKRIIKQALAATPREDVAHRYNLNLLHMNHLLKAANVELLQVVKEFEADARAQEHQDIVLLAHIIRIRAHFSLRRWDSLLATLDESEILFASFRLVLLMHYLNMRALYHGRAADDTSAKKQLSRLYPLMDRAMDRGMLSELRSSGGMVTIPLRAPNGSTQQLLVQSTPINVLWALTYLSSVVARRDLLGSFSQCRTLNHTRAMRQFEHSAHPDDLWDSGFSFRHGVAEALELRHKVNKLRAEVMMEEALAMLCRSSFEQVATTVEILHANNLFLTHSHQLALLYGHFMHSIGLPDKAVRYYKAAQSLLVAGSEMRLIVDINLMAAQGGFSNLQLDLDRASHVNVMADQCRAGTNGALNAVGFFLLSLTEPERVSSKRKLTFSYEVCRRGKLNILYALIFAFTTAQHLFGDRERQLKQLESGRDIARLLGGKDRADNCGQLPLGLWYNTKLRDHYRLDGRFDDEKAAAADAERHLRRMQEVYAYGRAHFPPRPSI